MYLDWDMAILPNISRMAAIGTSLYNPKGALERNGAVASLDTTTETVLAIGISRLHKWYVPIWAPSMAKLMILVFGEGFDIFNDWHEHMIAFRHSKTTQYIQKEMKVATTSLDDFM